MPTGGSIDDGLMLQVRNPGLDAWPFAVLAGLIGTVTTLYQLPDQMTLWGSAIAAVFVGVLLTVLVGWPLAAARGRRAERLRQNHRDTRDADKFKAIADLKARDVARAPELP